MKSPPISQGIFVILGLAGVAIVLASTSVYGPGLSPDSVGYIFAANSLLSGDGYQGIDGSYVSWPPLFPTLLAGLGQLGIEPLDGARFINAVVFGLIIFFTGQLLLSHLRSRAIAILGAASLLVSVVLIRVSVMAWSEPLFVLLSVLFVIYLSKFLTGKRIGFLLLIAIFAALACLERYIGFTLVLTGSISIFFFMRDRTFREKFTYVTVFSLISSVPLFAWLGRNYWEASTLTGNRLPSTTNFFVNVGDTLNAISTWLLPSNYVTTGSVKIFLVVLGVSVLGTLMAVVLKSNLRARSDVPVTPLVPAVTFVLVYAWSVVVLSTMYANYSAIADRLLTPIYIFVLLFVLIGIEKTVKASAQLDQHWRNSRRLWLAIGLIFVLSGVFFNEWTVGRLLFHGEVKNPWVLANLLSADGSILTKFRVIIWVFGISSVILGFLVIALRRKPWTGQMVIVGIFIIWLIYPVGQTYVYISTKLDSGAGGYNSAAWRTSALIDHLYSYPLDGEIYSNDANAVYILTQAPATSIPNSLPFEALKNSATALVQFRASIATDTGKTYLVWIDNERLLDPLRSPVNFDSVSSMFDLEEVVKFPDGGIYLFK